MTRRAPRTPQGEASRQRLVEAAIALFAERGYAATGIDAVCRRAGVARTALYWHFGSKEGLLAAVIERVGRAWIEEIRKSAYLAADPEERLERLVQAWQALVEEQPHLLRLLLLVQLERGGSSRATRRALERVRREAETALVQGMEDSLGAPVPDADLIAHTMLSLLSGALLRRLIDPEVALDRLFAELRRAVRLLAADHLAQRRK